jgi:hypothetical protein
VWRKLSDIHISLYCFSLLCSCYHANCLFRVSLLHVILCYVTCVTSRSPYTTLSNAEGDEGGWVILWHFQHIDYTVSDDRMNWKRLLKWSSHSQIRYYPGICLHRLRKTMQNLREAHHYPSQHMSLSLMLPPTVSRPVSLGVKHPSGAYDQISITCVTVRSCSCGVPSLTRGRVCLLYVLLPLASAVFLGSESLGTCDHILLSQIWDFPFRRLLRLAGSWWRYSIPHTGRPTYDSITSQI